MPLMTRRRIESEGASARSKRGGAMILTAVSLINLSRVRHDHRFEGERGRGTEGKQRATRVSPRRRRPTRQLLLAEESEWLNKLAYGHDSGEAVRDGNRAPVGLQRPSLAFFHQVVIVFFG